MDWGSWLFDAILGMTLIWLAWKALNAHHLFNSIVNFMVFGLLVSLSWIRLQAPDLAIAEAVLGAGITGALLLASLERLQLSGIDEDQQTEQNRPTLPVTVMIVAVAVALVALLGYAFSTLPETWQGLTPYVERQMAVSGVQAQVTAVLLNFRGYDTLLEMAVLLVALFGTSRVVQVKVIGLPPEKTPVLTGLLVMLVPVGILCAGYILWRGGHSAGGAFQAGAVLGGIAVLLHVSARDDLLPQHNTVKIRLLIALGSSLFVAVASGVMVFDHGLLQYPVQYAGVFIQLIELACAVSIGLILLFLFLGGVPDGRTNQ